MLPLRRLLARPRSLVNAILPTVLPASILLGAAAFVAMPETASAQVLRYSTTQPGNGLSQEGGKAKPDLTGIGGKNAGGMDEALEQARAAAGVTVG